MSLLPYWDHSVELDMDTWAPYGLDYTPVSVIGFHSDSLRSIASLSLEVGSEFLCLRSFKSGSVGPLLRESLIDPGRRVQREIGFTLLLGYSRIMEALSHMLVQVSPGLNAGLTLCGVWDREMLVDECKVIALVSEVPFFDEDRFLGLLEKALVKATGNCRNTTFFAERFGYRRFSVPYDTDDVMDLRISRVLFDLEMEETHEIVGPVPEVGMPDFGHGV